MSLIKEMELERFLERDILKFLDQKAEENKQKTSQTKLEQALTEKDVVEARTILRNAINKYNESNDKQEKEKLLTIIQELIIIGKNHADKTIINKLTQDIELLEKSGQLKKNTEKITILEEIQQTQRAEDIERENEIEIAQKIEQKITELTKILFVNIRKKEINETIKTYQELKQNFEKYPSRFINKKKEIYNDLLSFYKIINNMIEKPVQIFNEENEEKVILNSINKLIEEIEQEITQQNLKQAKNKILDLNHRISLIPEKYINIKTRLKNTANTLIKRTEFNKRIQN